MNILFICHRFPFPPARGGKIRPFNMIRHLSQSHRVVVASLAHTQRELDEGAGLKNHCAEVIAEVLPNSTRYAHCAAALPSSMPSSAAYFWSSRLQHRILEAARRTAFDAVWVHCAFVARYALPVSCPYRVLDYGDLDSGKWLDYSRQRAFPLSLGYALEARKLRSYERQLATHFHHCTVTTSGELQEFKTLGVDVPCEVIPNGVDYEYFQWSPPTDPAPVIVFVGRMDYYPNVDGILQFCNRIYPLIRRQVPEAQLRIVGSNPIARVRALARIPGVTVTGHVPDVRPHVADAAVAVIPLRLGRGTQNKMLEAMAIGIPVVATSVAAKGVQAVPGRDFLVGDSPEEFAAGVASLLRDPGLRRSLAQAARRQIETTHSWPLSMKIVDRVLSLASTRFAPEGMAGVVR